MPLRRGADTDNLTDREAADVDTAPLPGDLTDLGGHPITASALRRRSREAPHGVCHSCPRGPTPIPDERR